MFIMQSAALVEKMMSTSAATIDDINQTADACNEK